MEIKVFEIKPLVGFGDVKFGSEQSEVENILGEPEEIEDLPGEADESNATVWNYWEDGHTIFFEEDFDNRCTCFETDHENAVLFGNHIFDMNEAQITGLMNANGFSDIDAEDEEWGERRVSFNDAVVDFYFENDKLVSVSWGVFIDLDTNKAKWPQ